MSLAQLGRTPTPISLKDAAASLRDAVRAELPSADNPQALELLLALIWLETGRGQSVTQYNYGNLAAGGYANGVEHISFEPFWRPAWYDDEKSSTHQRMLDGQAPSAFRAYGDSQEGMRAFVRLLAGSRYGGLVAAARSGSVESFVQALHDSGYSKDYGPQHAPTFRSLVSDIRSAAVLPMQTLHSGVPDMLLIAVPVVLALAIFAMTLRPKRRYTR